MEEGQKSYDDMSAEEQAVVDGFEGRESYEETLSKRDYYLAPIGFNSDILRLNVG